MLTKHSININAEHSDKVIFELPSNIQKEHWLNVVSMFAKNKRILSFSKWEIYFYIKTIWTWTDNIGCKWCGYKGCGDRNWKVLPHLSNGRCSKTMHAQIFLFTTCLLVRNIVLFHSLGGHKLAIFLYIFFFYTNISYVMLNVIYFFLLFKLAFLVYFISPTCACR